MQPSGTRGGLGTHLHTVATGGNADGQWRCPTAGAISVQRRCIGPSHDTTESCGIATKADRHSCVPGLYAVMDGPGGSDRPQIPLPDMRWTLPSARIAATPAHGPTTDLRVGHSDCLPTV